MNRVNYFAVHYEHLMNRFSSLILIINTSNRESILHTNTLHQAVIVGDVDLPWKNSTNIVNKLNSNLENCHIRHKRAMFNLDVLGITRACGMFHIWVIAEPIDWFVEDLFFKFLQRADPGPKRSTAELSDINKQKSMTVKRGQSKFGNSSYCSQSS